MVKKYKFIVFLLLLLVLLIAAEKSYDYFLLENLNIKPSYVSRKKINADIIVTGNCVPYTTVSPRIMEKITTLKTYNLAEHGADFTENYLSLLLYLKNNKSPQYLLVYVSPETFDNRYNFFKSYHFSAYLFDDSVKKTIEKLDPFYYYWSSVPFLKYAYYNNKFTFQVTQGAKHYYQNKKEPYLKDGYNPYTDPNLKYDLSFLKGRDFSWDKTKEESLLKLIDLAKKKKIKLLFYESPLYAGHSMYQSNRGEILSKIRQLARQNKVDFLEFDTLQMAHDQRNFVSTNSLNYKCSIEFSTILAKRLN